MFIAICGVSGSGKTTVVQALLAQEPRLQQLITTTTRLPRSGEANHRDYHFVNEQQFQTSQWICPIRHRGAWYGIAPQDLAACTQLHKVAALRPDKLEAIQQLVPTISFFLIRPDLSGPCEPDDQLTLASQRICTSSIVNDPGQLACAVSAIRAQLSLEVFHDHTRSALPQAAALS